MPPRALRRARRAGPEQLTLLLRVAAPAAYGAGLIGGLFAPSRSLHPLSIIALVAFIAYFLWRIHSLVSRERAAELERVEVGFLAVLALATAVEIVAPPPGWTTVSYGVLMVGLATAVPLPGVLTLPLAAAAPWVPWVQWLNRTAQLELIVIAAATVAAVERRRRRRLTLALDKMRLDASHLDALNQGGGARSQGDLSKLDDVLYGYLEEVKENTGAHGAVLAVKAPGEALYVRELVSDSHNIREDGVLNLEGTAFQWILRSGKPLRIGHLRDPRARLGYYRGKVSVRSFLGVPVGGGDAAQGVLAVDSLQEEAFHDAHQTILRVAAHQVATILAQIQALEQVKREARDFKHLHEFSKRLGSCDSRSDVLDFLLEAVRERLGADFSAVVLLTEEGELSVERVNASRWNDLLGRRFQANDGLAGWVLASRQYLHYERGRSGARRPLFSRAAKIPDFQSLLLHPLEAHGESLGVLCVGSEAPKAFEPPAVAFCEVLAQQGAQGLLQLRTLEQLRDLAATDGLTRLANRRVLLERLAAEVVRSYRYETPLSLLLLDVDHFKKVNDRYGHPAGDEVLRKIAGGLLEFARETDLVARFGGEEFAVLLPSTDAEGSAALAERIRAGIAALEIEWEEQVIPVRASVGHTQLAAVGDTADALISRADQALYAAKEGGRNRVVCYDQVGEYLSWGS